MCSTSVEALPLTDAPAALIETWLATQLGFCEPALKEQMPRHNSCSFGTGLKNLVICSIRCSVGAVVGVSVCAAEASVDVRNKCLDVGLFMVTSFTFILHMCECMRA